MDRNEVATIDIIKRWDYPDKIKTVVNANEVNLLIDANCVQALEPRELTESKTGSICIQNRYSQNKSENLNCNRIMVNSVVTGLHSNHYFTQSDKVRDTSIELLLMKMYEHDFVERHLQHRANKISINYDKLSSNDKRFLDLMDQKESKRMGITNCLCH